MVGTSNQSVPEMAFDHRSQKTDTSGVDDP